MVLLRLSPLIPFNALNYIAGVTSILFRAYVWAMFAILPGTILYVFLGASAGSLVDSKEKGSNNFTVTIITIVCGIVFGVLAIGLTSKYARAELNRLIAIQEQEEEDGEQNVSSGDDDLEVGKEKESVSDNASIGDSYQNKMSSS